MKKKDKEEEEEEEKKKKKKQKKKKKEKKKKKKKKWRQEQEQPLSRYARDILFRNILRSGLFRVWEGQWKKYLPSSLNS